MSEFKNFRITLHLNNFFRDHRTTARLFINKKFKSIGDLEDHIENIFNITNFYLTCKDHFLPPSEDIRILQNEDSVWVWNSSTSANEVVEKCEDELIVIKKDRVKKKKKKQKEKINGAVSDFEVKTTSTPNISDVNINCPNWEHYNENDTQTHKNTNSSRAELEGKKNKKRKLINQFDENVASENETLKIDEQNLESIVNPSQSKSKVSDNVNKKKELKDEETFKETCDIKSSSQKTLSHIKTVLLNSSQIIGSHQKQSENESKFLKNANKKSDGDLSDTESFEYNCLNPNNKFTVEDNANSKTEFENQSPTVENADHEMVFETNISNLAENTNNYSGKTDCDSAVEIKPFRHSSSVGALLKAMNTMSDTASEQSFVTKRKRQKRVRKRKSKKSTFGNGLVQSNDYFQPPAPCNSYNGVSIENTENTSLNIKNSKTVKGPNTHIKFEDEDDEVIASIVIAEAEQKVEQKTFDINLTEDDLEKYPLMNNLIPRNRDIIAFKVLKISEHYTPEISKSIIAEVVNYEKQGGKTEVKILSGKNELLAPQGKFYIENDTQETEEEEKNEIFFWGNIVEPRLLFP